MDFSATIRAQIEGRRVRRGRLVWLDFASAPMGVWNGFRSLRTLDGRRWLGARNIGRIEGLRQPINGATPEIKLTLSPVNEQVAALARAESAEYYNRAVTIFSQFFDDEWRPLDAPFAEAWGLMHSLIVSREEAENGWLRTVTLTAENPFASTKRRPRNSYLTDRDQQQRHPGDMGLSQIAGIETKTIKFP